MISPDQAMKQTKLALSAVMIVAIGLTGANFVTGSGLTDQEKLGAYQDFTVYGHVTVIHSDPDGNILSYAQTDNLVANIGKDCMAALVFGGTAGGSECTAATDTTFNTIVLFNGQSFPTEMNATGLLTVDITAPGLAIADGDLLTPSQNTAATGADYVDGTGGSTDITNTFTAGATQTVDGAALFNGTPFDAVLAGQTFSSVTLNNLDTLAVTWTITLG